MFAGHLILDEMEKLNFILRNFPNEYSEMKEKEEINK